MISEILQKIKDEDGTIAVNSILMQMENVRDMKKLGYSRLILNRDPN